MKVVGNLKGSSEMKVFASVKEAADFLGVFGSSVSRSIKVKHYLHDWALTYEDTWDGKPLVYEDVVVNNGLKYVGIVGLSPIGGYVYFENVNDIAEKLGINADKVRCVLRGNKKTARGWVFTMYNSDYECVPLTKEMIDATDEVRGRKKGKDKAALPVKNEDEDTRVPLRVGLVEAGMAPAICPICHAVLGMDINTHLNKCLEGHEFRIKGGKWIYVYD